MSCFNSLGSQNFTVNISRQWSTNPGKQSATGQTMHHKGSQFSSVWIANFICLLLIMLGPSSRSDIAPKCGDIFPPQKPTADRTNRKRATICVLQQLYLGKKTDSENFPFKIGDKFKVSGKATLEPPCNASSTLLQSKAPFIWFRVPETTLPSEATLSSVYMRKRCPCMLAESKLTLLDYS